MDLDVARWKEAEFRTKSVLCPECADRQNRIGNPYARDGGRR